MKKIAVFMSLILIFNLLLFVPALAEQQIIAEPSVAAGYNHVLGLNQYGRVFSAGDNTYGQCDTFHWKGITQVCAGKTFSAGLKDDGTVIIAGVLSEETGISAEELSDIKQISAGDDFLAALDRSGYVHIVGSAGNIDTSSWENIEKIACGNNHVVALKENTVIGSDCDSDNENGNMDLGFEDVSVEDIYAGESLTVVKDSEGKLYHYGNGTYVTDSSSEEAGKWVCTEWEDIKTLHIQQGSGTNAIVIAVNNDGTILTDGTNLNKTNNWSEGFLNELQDLSDVNSINLFDIKERTYAIAIKSDGTSECIINVGENEDREEIEAGELFNELKRFNLMIKPVEFEVQGWKIVPSFRTVGILLENGDVCTIGSTELVGFKNINDLQATVSSTDYFLGVNDENVILTNLPEAEKKHIITWQGVEKTATATWNGTNLITALRWDGRVYSTDENDLLKDLENVIDISGGNYYTVALTREKKVHIGKNSSGNDINVSSWTNIEKIFSGFAHVVGITEDGNCIAAGNNGDGQCNVTGPEWQNIVDIACSNLFTVGVDKNGKCHYTGKTTGVYMGIKEKIESWTNVEKVYASNNYIVAQKSDGKLECAYAISNKHNDFKIMEKIEEQLKNTYYKDNTFYTFKVEENTAVVEYYSDEDLEVYFSYFDEAGRPIGFEKKVLEPVPNLTKVEFTNEKSHSFTVSIGEPAADKMKFYMEHEAVGDTVKIRHCALDGQRIMLAFYDDKDNMLDIKVKTLQASNVMTEGESFTCAGATKYKLFIRDGMVPLYKYEGELN